MNSALDKSVQDEAIHTAKAEVTTSTPKRDSHEKYHAKVTDNVSTWQALYAFISYTPQRCRYDPNDPPRFSTWLNVLFAFAGCFTVANLYYTHPYDDFTTTRSM